MRLVLLLPVIAACAHGPAPVAPRAPAPPTEAGIVQRTHAVLDAFDRGALDPGVLAPGFVRFENERLYDRAYEVAHHVGKAHPPDETRSWEEQHVYLRPNDALFVGKSIEHLTGKRSGGRAFVGWYTMEWVRTGDRWQVAHWSWQAHRSEAERAQDNWDEVFRQSVGFEHAPNRLLVQSVRGVHPGDALDVMMGQGRNALYLASQGWHVTGVDISDEGIRQARAEAARRHLELDAVQADVDHYDFGTARWDLVTMIYAGDSADQVKRLQRSLKPGGMFVIEYFLAGPDSCCGGFAAGQLHQLFASGYDILRDEVVEDIPDWARDRAKLVRFVARKR